MNGRFRSTSRPLTSHASIEVDAFDDMIILRPTNLHWIDGTADDPSDLCAHSGVDFRIDDHVLIRPSNGEWAVSAIALFLLRTLSRPHTKSTQTGALFTPDR